MTSRVPVSKQLKTKSTTHPNHSPLTICQAKTQQHCPSAALSCAPGRTTSVNSLPAMRITPSWMPECHNHAETTLKRRVQGSNTQDEFWKICSNELQMGKTFHTRGEMCGKEEREVCWGIFQSLPRRRVFWLWYSGVCIWEKMRNNVNETTKVEKQGTLWAEIKGLNFMWKVVNRNRGFWVRGCCILWHSNNTWIGRTYRKRAQNLFSNVG